MSSTEMVEETPAPEAASDERGLMDGLAESAKNRDEDDGELEELATL